MTRPPRPVDESAVVADYQSPVVRWRRVWDAKAWLWRDPQEGDSHGRGLSTDGQDTAGFYPDYQQDLR